MKNLHCGLMAVALFISATVLLPTTAMAYGPEPSLEKATMEAFPLCTESDPAIHEAANIIDGTPVTDRDAAMMQFVHLLGQVGRHGADCTPAAGYESLASLARAITHAKLGQPHANLVDYGKRGCGENSACRAVFGLKPLE